MPLHVSSTCALHNLWYHHAETSEWSKIAKIQFYKYEQIVVKFMCELWHYESKRVDVLICMSTNVHPVIPP